MIRTQIQFEEKTLQRLKALSARRGCSISALVRESVGSFLEEDSQKKCGTDVFDLAGKYRSEIGVLARQHDQFLEDGW